jgi:hypothetical protein
MSSTRKKKEDRGLDFFATPAWVVKAILPYCHRFPLTSFGDAALSPTLALDPCAGRGAILAALQDATHVAIETFGFELSPELTLDASLAADNVTQRDALSPEPWLSPDGQSPSLIIQNPPFLHALEFVERALKEVSPYGEVAVLLRLAFLASEERREFHKRHPSDVFVLPKRPSFCVVVRCTICSWEATLSPEAKIPKKCADCECPVKVTRTDSADYAWFLWGPGRGGRWRVLDVPSSRKEQDEQDDERRRCHACDEMRPEVGELPDSLPLCKPCAKAHRMGYRCGEQAKQLFQGLDER